MRESSKLGYTCAYSEYKWTMKCKYIYESICCSLIVQVYIQVLIKTTFNLVFTTWSTKTNKNMNMLKISYMKKHVNKLGVFRDSYQTKELYSNSPKHGGCPTKPPW